MATIAPQLLGANGSMAELTLSATTLTGDDFLNDGQTVLILESSAAGPETVTITGVAAQDSGRTESLVVNIDNGDRAFVGPFKPRNWNNGLGRIDIVSTDVLITAAVVRYSIA